MLWQIMKFLSVTKCILLTENLKILNSEIWKGIMWAHWETKRLQRKGLLIALIVIFWIIGNRWRVYIPGLVNKEKQTRKTTDKSMQLMMLAYLVLILLIYESYRFKRKRENA